MLEMYSVCHVAAPACAVAADALGLAICALTYVVAPRPTKADEHPLTTLYVFPRAATAVAAVAGDPAQQAERAPWLYAAQRPGSESSAYTDDYDSDEDLFLSAGLPVTGRRSACMSGDASYAPLTAWANRVQSDAPLNRVGAVAFSSWNFQPASSE